MNILLITQITSPIKIKGKGRLLLTTITLLFIFGCDMAPDNVEFIPPESYKDEKLCKDTPEKKQPCDELLNESIG